MHRPLLLLLALFTLAEARTPITQKLHRARSSPNLQVVFLGDGYLKSDARLMRSHAMTAWNRLKAVSPFSENLPRIEVSLVLTFSKRGKRFGEADFRYGSIESSLNRIKVPGVGTAKADARQAVPDADLIILLTRKKGRSHGGGGVIVLAENGADAIAHEVGHALGGLADEYQSTSRIGDRRELPTNRDLKAPNVTLDRYIDPTNNETIARTAKWGHFLELPNATPLVSAYQGGYYRTVGVWRPSYRCLMSDSQSASFCPVCHEHMTRALFKKLKKRFDHKGYHERYPLKNWK
jgi:hypothetical protein